MPPLDSNIHFKKVDVGGFELTLVVMPDRSQLEPVVISAEDFYRLNAPARLRTGCSFPRLAFAIP